MLFHFRVDILQIARSAPCACAYMWASSYLKALERCLSMYLFVSPQHIWLLLQPLWPVCGSAQSQPPIALLQESRVITECCWTCAAAVPRTPGNMSVHSFTLGWRWPPADSYVIFFPIFVFKIRFFKRIEWNQQQLLPDIYVIIKICHREHWFMPCLTFFFWHLLTLWTSAMPVYRWSRSHPFSLCDLMQPYMVIKKKMQHREITDRYKDSNTWKKTDNICHIQWYNTICAQKQQVKSGKHYLKTILWLPKLFCSCICVGVILFFSVIPWSCYRWMMTERLK